MHRAAGGRIGNSSFAGTHGGNRDGHKENRDGYTGPGQKSGKSGNPCETNFPGWVLGEIGKPKP